MKEYADQSILVTGGAGFIGSYLVEQLVQLNAHVTVLDDLSTGSLHHLAKVKEDIIFLNGSITNVNTCREATKDSDFIFHLAADVSVPASFEHPHHCFETNIMGTINMLEAARVNNVQRFIFSSSSAVYGNHQGVCNETTMCQPTSPYGFSKLMGEQLCQQYAKQFELVTVCLRYFNVYGPRQNPQGTYAAVVAKFTEYIKQNKPIIIFGDGKQTRDFVPVQNVVEANLKLGLLPDELMQGNVFNIATGKSISLLELIEQLKIDFPDFDADIQFKEARDGDIKHSQANCSKYEGIVG